MTNHQINAGENVVPEFIIQPLNRFTSVECLPGSFQEKIELRNCPIPGVEDQCWAWTVALKVSQILAELQSLTAITSQQRVPAFPLGKEKEGPELDAGHQAGPAPLIDGFLGHERRAKPRAQAVN